MSHWVADRVGARSADGGRDGRCRRHGTQLQLCWKPTCPPKMLEDFEPYIDAHAADGWQLFVPILRTGKVVNQGTGSVSSLTYYI
jgi:hypothetical protein